MAKNLTRKDILIDENWISTPDMGEYLDSQLISDFAKDLVEGDTSEYFIETPFATSPGYYPTENAFIISGKPTFLTDQSEIDDTGLNTTDGDTIYLRFNEIIDDGNQIELTGGSFNSVKDYLYITGNLEKSTDKVGLRLIGMNAPELPHFRLMYVHDKTLVKTTTLKYKDLKSKGDKDYIKVSLENGKIGSYQKNRFAYLKHSAIDANNLNIDSITHRNNDDVITFIYNEDVDEYTGKKTMSFYEIQSITFEDGAYKYKICTGHSVDDNDSISKFKQAIMMQQDLINTISTAEEVIYMIDNSYLVDKQGGQIPMAYRKESEKIADSPLYAFKSLWKNLTEEGPNTFTQMPKRYFGQDNYGRFLSAVYVKIHNPKYGKVWINLAKYLISKYSEVELLPFYSNSGALQSEFNNFSDAFKLWTYDKSKQIYIDKLSSAKVDDRADIQKEITGVNYDELTNHTVMIGDTLLVIPPISISVVNQMNSERVQLLRAKGSVTKTMPKNNRIIEMNLFFYGEDAINGVPYEATTPSGQKMIYHMNGLRGLISQFKFTPFLPIHNHYINYVLNVDAVSLEDIEVSTVANYPKLLQAKVTLREFDYRQYMPEIIPPNPDTIQDLYTNLYSQTINWEVFRYYYQRSLIKGEEVIKLDFNSDEYIYETLGQKTALQPVEFNRSSFDLYVANEEHLKQRKMTKEALERSAIQSNIIFNDNEKNLIVDLMNIYTKTNESIVRNANEFSDIFTPADPKAKIVYSNYDNGNSVDLWKDGIIGGIYQGIYNPKSESNSSEPVYNITVGLKETYNQFLVPFMESVKTDINNIDTRNRLISGMKFIVESYYDSDDIITKRKLFIGYELSINWDASGYKELSSKIKRYLSRILNKEEKDVFPENKLRLGMNVPTTKRDKLNPDIMNNQFEVNYGYELVSSKDMTTLLAHFGAVADSDTLDEIEYDAELWNNIFAIADTKDNIDLETTKSMKFDRYDIGNPIVTNVTCQYKNIFSNIGLKVHNSYASQYTGGSDSRVTINMIATDEDTVNSLNILSNICVQRLIDFRKIISSSPLRIDSEITRLFGINEVVIDAVNVNTIPNQPGVYDIAMILTSTDRTLRNREAMKRIDNIKQATSSEDPIVKTKNFFEIEDTLAKIELYPDLEIPTIKELEHLGFSYIQYKNNGKRVFPDADFYFSYSHVFSSAMLRKSIVEFFSNSENAELYRLYSGNLNKDEAEVVYNLNANSGEETTVKSNEDKIFNNLMTYKKVNPEAFVKYSEVAERMKTNAELTESSKSVPINNEETLKKYKDKVDELTKLKNTLTECIDSSSYDSYTINPALRVGLTSNVPFSNEETLISEKTSIKLPDDIHAVISNYDNIGEISIDTSVKDIKKSYFETDAPNELVSADIKEFTKENLSKLILAVLKMPLNSPLRASDSSILEAYSDYHELIKLMKSDSDKLSMYATESYGFVDTHLASSPLMLVLDYIGKVVLKNKDFSINKSYSIGTDTKIKLTLAKVLDTIFTSIGRAATANLGVYDSEISKETNPQAYVEIDGKMYPKVLRSISGQVSSMVLAENIDDFNSGFVYGPYGIRKYNPSEISMIYGKEFGDLTDGFLDPYFNKDLSRHMFGIELSNEELDKRLKMYRYGISSNKSFSQEAVFRNMLVWLYKFLNDDRGSLLPSAMYSVGVMKTVIDKGEGSIDGFFANTKQWFTSLSNSSNLKSKMKAKEKNADTFSDEDELELQSIHLEYQYREEEERLEKELKEMMGTVEKDHKVLGNSLIGGLFAALGALFLNDFNTPLYKSIATGNQSYIVEYIEKVKASYVSAQELTTEVDMEMRRYFQSLDYLIAGSDRFFSSGHSTDINAKLSMDKYSLQGRTKQLYLNAAETPSVYLMHSFYDMVMHDMRGRMARAFPTYYMLLIDEGRDMGVWRLQDNFYDVSSIVEFQVVNSRKIAATTASITMTNMFGTFTTEDDDMKDDYEYTFKDTWNSIFSPRKFAAKEYQRVNEARDINRAKLKPGARVNLRFGYSADASNLPTTFNGSVAEVLGQGDLINIICQGDGTEVANPAMFNPADAKDVSDIKYNSNLLSGFLGKFDNATTPREMLITPLAAEGTFIQEIIKDISKGRLFNANPFGLVHFGDKNYKEIFTSYGEVEQNIYEAISTPSWGDKTGIAANSTDYQYAMKESPSVRVGLGSDKSYWDLMHIAASISPDFIAAIAPFQLRSTIFYGHPRYYYAYKYERLPNYKIVEKRKPFQQYHIYTSYTDIISNTITASDRDVRTCAVGVYKGSGNGSKKNKSVGPLYLDIDIYPENQKMTNVDCNFESKFASKVPFTVPVVDFVADEIGENGGYQTAWRATASALKDTVKDMYTGELVVMGDPTVKPYDKIMISDIYENIQGMCEVETVVHSFGLNTGFVTSITPDCISAIDNKYEQISNNTIKEIMAPVLTAHIALLTKSARFSRVNRAVFLKMSKLIDLGVDGINGAKIEWIKKLLSESDIDILRSEDTKIFKTLAAAFGVSNVDYNLYKSSKTFNDAIKTLSGFSGKISGADDLTKFFAGLGTIEEVFKKVEPSEMITMLDEAIASTKSSSKLATLNNTKNLLEDLSNSYIKSLGNLSNIELSKASIDKLLLNIHVNAGATKTDDVVKMIAEINKLTKGKSTIKLIDNVDDWKKLTTNLSKLSKYVDDVDDVAKLASQVSGVVTDATKALGYTDEIADALKAANAISKGNRIGGTLATLGMNLVFMVAEIAITKSVQEFIERKLKNLQVLTLFPLVKDGKVMTAGIEGHKGSVFGSPSYTEEGFMESMMIKFFDNEAHSKVFNFVRDMYITTSEMRSIVNSYKRDNGYGTATGSTEVLRTSEQAALLTTVANNNISGYNAYRELYVYERLDSKDKNTVQSTYRKYSLTDISEASILTTTVVSDKLEYISRPNSLIEKLIEQNLFRFAGDTTLNLSNIEHLNSNGVGIDSLPIPEPLYVDKKRIANVKILTKGLANGKETLPIYVLPYLRPDAISVLELLVEEICKVIQPDYDTETCDFENLMKHNIILQRGVMINQKASWFSTGFSFTLEVKDFPEFDSIIEKVKLRDEQLSLNNNLQFKLLNIEKATDLGGNTYNVKVSPKL